MRGLATKLVVLLALEGLLSYLVLPGVLENQVAQRLQGVLGDGPRLPLGLLSRQPQSWQAA